jgi:hypothetical protein
MEDRAAAPIGPRIEERPPDWMLPFKRQHEPSAPRVVVALERLKPAGNTLRHNPRPIPKTADQTVGSAQVGSRRRVDSLSRRSTWPGVGQLAAGLDQVLGEHLDVGQHRHEVRVACPTWHQMEMDVIGDAGTGDAA